MLLRNFVIGLISFLTLVDLFAVQAILPSLVAAYQVSPAAMGFAVNASTIGMAVAGVLVALASRHINRRHGVWISLALLAIPTSLLAVTDDITVFTWLRIAQGVFMSAAFTLTMAYLAENCSAEQAAGALAAYITGNVASNLVGRLVSASIADHFGLASNFYAFALLNLSGAVLAYYWLGRTTPMAAPGSRPRSPLETWSIHLRDPALRASFAIGFLILFVFIGTFTFVNFVLADPPIALSPVALGFVYFVFLPSVLTTPLAGKSALRYGTRPAFLGGVLVAAAGLPLLLAPSLVAVLAGLALLAAGTFFAQAVATGFVSRTAAVDPGSASGLYLSSYYLGGLLGSLVLGQVFDAFGWVACVAGIGVALLLAALLARSLRTTAELRVTA